MEIKSLKINPPKGYEIDREKSTFEEIFYKPIEEKKLPSTWEEFCYDNLIKNESFITGNSDIITTLSKPRNCVKDKNLLPTKELAEAMLALCQLIQLRDCYNNGWKPEWTKPSTKYCIEVSGNIVNTFEFQNCQVALAFKTKELRDQFFENFRDLLEIAKPLL